MSGGFFDYNDMRLNDVCEKLRVEIARCRAGHEYHIWSEEFLQELISAYNATRELAVKLHRIDWCISGDDSEDSYWLRLAEDMEEIEYDSPGRDAEWLRGCNDG